MLLLAVAMAVHGVPSIDELPLWDGKAASRDWLLGGVKEKAGVFRTEKPDEIVLANGLIARRFRLAPNAATVALDNLVTGEALLRAVKPEAEVTLDGKTYAVGGLGGQPDLAYLTDAWLGRMKADPDAFRLVRFGVGKTAERMVWRPNGDRLRPLAPLGVEMSSGRTPSPGSQAHRPLPPGGEVTAWPPKGVSLTMLFEAPPSGPKYIQVVVRYELYDGAPIIAKQISILNRGEKPVRLNGFKAEILGLVEPESVVDSFKEWREPNLTVTTDYTFAGMSMGASNRAVRLLPDKAYATQVNYNLETPCLLEAAPPLGPDFDIPPGGKLDGFHVFELLHDSTDRERRGLAVRQLYRRMAPWTTESPLMLHQTSSDPKMVKAAIDQAAECGFEMVILSFGSGLNMEDASPGNVAKFKDLADYAHSKGVQMGGYSLLASRRIDDANDVIDPKTGKPDNAAVFGSSPCLGSEWGNRYFKNLEAFLSGAGFDLLEHDGSYPGDVCASTAHPGHRGLEDSQWTQYQKIAAFYRECRAKGIYLNVPDNYHLAGSNKTGMGYRETNWSLPRAQQHIHARQNLFDGSWEKPPTMGWMFTPLVEYQGGGAAATIEPLHEHIEDYERHLVNNLAYGAQSCYRGPRLYDSPEVKAMVQRHVAWFKKYRDILESDVIHVRRADGKSLDCILHVNPSLPIKGLAVVWNPGDQPVEAEIALPLYYTGLSESATIAEKEAKSIRLKVDRSYAAHLKVKVPANGWNWYVIR